MSGFVIPLLTCDGVDDGEVCLEEFGGDHAVPSLVALRALADPEGWWSGEGRDLCPDHKPDGAP